VTPSPRTHRATARMGRPVADRRLPLTPAHGQPGGVSARFRSTIKKIRVGGDTLNAAVPLCVVRRINPCIRFPPTFRKAMYPLPDCNENWPVKVPAEVTKR